MRVLIVGSGGREHALAWKIAASPLLSDLRIAPGNAGTASLGANVSIAADDIEALAAYAARESIDLVVVGPETPLALGLADRLDALGVPCFGPKAAAAEIEGSKAFAKAFMNRHGIPTAAWRSFEDCDAALSFAQAAPWPLVLKASGLAAGKGVILPESAAETEAAIRAILRDGSLGAAGAELLIEERLSGPELSLMAFCDGRTLSLMPPARDHKRLRDGDLGPNTGGMGAFAPVPDCPPEMAARLASTILEPALRGLAAEGRTFVGVLYAGLMLCAEGARVLEFNCRFGDPEAQALLPLFEGDLLATLYACALGKLDKAEPRWAQASSACVVLATPGYPEVLESGLSLDAAEAALEGDLLFHAATIRREGRLKSAGGRVLGACARGADLEAALKGAYALADRIAFPGARLRRDIGAASLAAQRADAQEFRVPSASGATSGADPRAASAPYSAYAAAGVDIDAGNRAVKLMSAAVTSTYNEAVLAGIGSFGGLYDAAQLSALRGPVLVASTDGVGTKVKLASRTGRYASVGEDIVNHCIDDILVQGARPLFFLDYFASASLDPGMVAQAVGGMAKACAQAGCVLLGGETAEMPGVYKEEEFDIAGTIVGVVERDRVLPRGDLRAGDVLVGLASSGLHTNGYSLARTALGDADLDAFRPELGATLGATLGEVLMAPHRSYLPTLWPLLSSKPGLVKALAHITGGGFPENIPRILPPGLRARVRIGAWRVPPVYNLIQRLGEVSSEEMYRVFNMGIGMIAIVAAERLAEFRAALAEDCFLIGELAQGEIGVDLL